MWWENREAWELWNAVKTQWRTGVTGAEGFLCPCPTGIDYPAMYKVAKTLDIEISPALLRKIQALEVYEINRSFKGIA